MPDVDRTAVSEYVYRRLAEPRFRQLLTARTPDGEHPVVVALLEDPISTPLRELEAFGGNANLVVPLLNGVVVVAMNRVDDDSDDGEGEDRSTDALTDQCTVGVFLERLRIDGGDMTYRFSLRHDGHTDSGTAELVAIAG